MPPRTRSVIKRTGITQSSSAQHAHADHARFTQEPSNALDARHGAVDCRSGGRGAPAGWIHQVAHEAGRGCACRHGRRWTRRHGRKRTPREGSRRQHVRGESLCPVVKPAKILLGLCHGQRRSSTRYHLHHDPHAGPGPNRRPAISRNASPQCARRDTPPRSTV